MMHMATVVAVCTVAFVVAIRAINPVAAVMAKVTAAAALLA